MKTNIFTSRLIFILIALFSFSGIAYAIYVQTYQNIEPCPLCIVQRIIYAAIGIVALIAAIANCQKYGRIIFAIITLLISCGGIYIAHHHVWLQGLPLDQLPMSCGMPMSVMFKNMPLTGFLHTILSGTAECAMMHWQIFGINAPKVSMYGFILTAIASVYILVCPRKK